MSVKTVQCCQCGSPLTCPEAGEPFIQCLHCSALLEIQDLERGSITRLHSALVEIREKAFEQDREIDRLKAEQELAKLDREWRERYRTDPDSAAGNAAISTMFVIFVFPIVALVALASGWSSRGPLTAEESRVRDEIYWKNMELLFANSKEQVQYPPWPNRANIPARIGSTLAAIAMCGFAYFAWRGFKRIVEAQADYQRQKAMLLSRIGR